jgi:hypothetical protein
MTKKFNISVSFRIISVLLFVAISVPAQTLTEYYRTYDDFLKKRSLPITEMPKPPFVRVIRQGDRPSELTIIDSTGLAIEKRRYSYNKTGNLATVTIYTGDDRMLKLLNYQPDSIQARMIGKLSVERWIPDNEACYTETFFDSSGNSVEDRIYAVNGYLIGIITHDYDQSGRMIRESIYKGEGAQLLEYSEFEFQLPDSIQIIRQYDGDGKLKSAVSLKIFH